MAKRPLVILVLSLLFITIGIVGIIRQIPEFKTAQPLPSDAIWVLLVSFIAIVCGAFMLRGKNWARWLTLAWMLFHVVISLLHSPKQVVVHAVIFVLIAYALLRAEARDYFSATNQRT